ncbi:serine/threonine protein kinase [Labilithrix luteola]|uniref:Serine/threonine protein kinase n=1 Tax=Labilithrix luteola TaxID=1391654 RepID=A0A0K1Q2K5_9BACT|nr:phosphotransferase [Labilithrix luteola]AKU99962.1 serine/threonine protein kinase [Labilithrix luteola]
MLEKRLSSRELAEPEAWTAIRHEAFLLTALGGRSTPTLLASGEDARGPWLRMARVPFPTLAQRLESASGPLESSWLERATRASFAALATLHEATDARGGLAVVHGDVSPANLAIDDEGRTATLLDLGLATFRDAPRRDGAFRGTLAYAAPEVARGEPPTVRSDLFALAATLLHGVTFAISRRGTTAAALLLNAAEVPILSPELRKIAERGPGHAAIVACLAHDAEARPASARDVVLALA